MDLLSINPASGEVLRSFPSLTEEGLRERIALAATAARQQFAAPLDHRILALRKLSTLVEAEAAELAHTIAIETGKPLRHAREEVASCAEVCRYYAEDATRLLAPELLAAGQGQAHVQSRPTGVILAVMPWNSPLWHGFRFAVPALVAGNAVLMKHAGSVPQCALHMAALVRRAGFPRGTYTALLMEDSLVETALNDERVQALTFTGPGIAGRALAAQAGWLLKRSALHLDGSDAFVVMPSADLEASVAACVRAFALGASIGKRIVLHGDVYKAVAGRFVAALEALHIGNPLLRETELGPLGTAAALQQVTEQVDAAVAAGGRVLTGGSRMVGAGNFFEPTLLSGVPLSAARDCMLGPVALLFRAEDVEDAIAIANSTPFAGSAAVWTRDPSEQQRLTADIRAGFVALNSFPADDPHLPMGGWAASGYGKELGEAGLREFLQMKTVWIA